MDQMYKNFQEWQINSLVFSWVFKIAMWIFREQYLKSAYMIIS
jgi:hypothetical protein